MHSQIPKTERIRQCSDCSRHSQPRDVEVVIVEEYENRRYKYEKNSSKSHHHTLFRIRRLLEYGKTEEVDTCTS